MDSSAVTTSLPSGYEITSDDWDHLGLVQRQQLFAELVGKFLGWVYENGWMVTFGETFRPAETAQLDATKGIGIADSLHTWRLAVDLNLFRAGKYLQATEAYATLGAKWKAMHPLCRWGGDFMHNPDGNHFSVSWDGRA